MRRARNRHRAPRRPLLPACVAAGGVLLVTIVVALWVVVGAGPVAGPVAVRPAAVRPAATTPAADGSRTANPDATAAGASPGRAAARTRTPAQALAAPLAGAGGLTALAQPAARARLVADVIVATNRERRVAGCPDLVADPVLAAAAGAHSIDMAVAGYFRHDSPDGRSPFDRMAAAGFDYTVAAENIAAGQRSAAEVVRDWMDSPEHRANILTCSLTRIGVGLATGGAYGYYWTQDLATPETGP